MNSSVSGQACLCAGFLIPLPSSLSGLEFPHLLILDSQVRGFAQCRQPQDLYLASGERVGCGYLVKKILCYCPPTVPAWTSDPITGWVSNGWCIHVLIASDKCQRRPADEAHPCSLFFYRLLNRAEKTQTQCQRRDRIDVEPIVD